MAEDIASDVLYPEVHKLFSTTQSIGFSVTYYLSIYLSISINNIAGNGTSNRRHTGSG